MGTVLVCEVIEKIISEIKYKIKKEKKSGKKPRSSGDCSKCHGCH